MTQEQKPAASIEVSVNGDKKSLRMPFARLNRILVILESAENLPKLAYDTNVQEAVLCEVFTERAEDRKTITFRPESLDEIEIDTDTTLKIFDWVGSHVNDFFIRQVENQVSQAEKYSPRLKSLHTTANGIADSASKMSAALPSDATQPIFGSTSAGMPTTPT